MSDLPVLEHLYQIENVTRTGTLVRNHEYWRGLVEGLRLSNRLSPEDIWLVKDGQERATGYMFLRRLPQGSYGILEASATGDAVADDLLELATTQALSDVVRPFSQRLPISVER